MKSKKIAFKFFLLAISLILVLLCAEVICRCYLEREYIINDVDVYVQKSEPQLHRISAIAGLNYELIPNATSDNGKFSINSKGIRDYDYEIPKPEGVYRIVILGDSVTFGAGYKLEQTYPKVLERLLNDFPGEKVNSGRDLGLKSGTSSGEIKFEVLNAGVCAYNALQKFIFFKSKLIDYQPDIVIFQFLNDDYFRNIVVLPQLSELYSKDTKNNVVSISIGEYFAVNFPNISPLPENLNRKFLRYSALYRFINKSTYDYLSRVNPDKYPPQAYKFGSFQDLKHSMKENKKVFQSFYHLSKKHNFQFILLLVPELVNRDKIDPWIKYECSRQFGFKVIDVYKLLKKDDIDLTTLRIIPKGLTHFNEKGHVLVGKIIFDWLNEHIL